ncbi:SDR family NAD(P)-dependent oxidoreductase [Chloroflexota bacterium]
MVNLGGKVVLITGAARKAGIGRASALRLADDGADILVVGRFRPPESFPDEEKVVGWRGLESVVSEVEAKGRRALAITADVTSSKEVDQMAERALSEFTRIDILVNNAGVTGQYRATVVESDEEEWEKTIAINLTAPFLCAKVVAKGMVERGEGGKIINVSSMFGKNAMPGTSAYAASKFGLIGLTQVLAMELAPHKINVNAICPGIIGTDITRNVRPGLTMKQALEKALDDHRAFTPLGRLGTPDDVANLIAFLASSDSDYMTGQAINITGGRVMH